MATINKQSMRDELCRLKSEFKQLSADKKITPESATLFNGLLMLLELLFAIFLEKTTKKTSVNSYRHHKPQRMNQQKIRGEKVR